MKINIQVEGGDISSALDAVRAFKEAQYKKGRYCHWKKSICYVTHENRAFSVWETKNGNISCREVKDER